MLNTCVVLCKLCNVSVLISVQGTLVCFMCVTLECIGLKSVLGSSVILYISVFIEYVNRVEKREVRDKMIVCGRVARWWDNEIV